MYKKGSLGIDVLYASRYTLRCSPVSRAQVKSSHDDSVLKGNTVHRNGAMEETSRVRFDNPEVATRGKSAWEVIRGWLVFKLFTYDSVVDNNLELYHLSKRVLGLLLTEKILRWTIFGQFAGGVNEKDTESVVQRLAERNISSIWFYSIERDLDEVPIPGNQAEFQEQERTFDEVNHKYLKSIEISATCNCDRPVRFAAVKLTAIVNPHLLNKLNKLLVEAEKVFSSLASPGKNTVERSLPSAASQEVIPETKLKGTLPGGYIGIVDWTSHFTIADNPWSKFKQLKMLAEDLTSFSDMEQEQYERFIERLLLIGNSAQSNGVRVLVDAEQTYFQRAIEHLTLHLLSKRHNSASPLIYNTLQTYFMKSFDHLLTYQAVARHYGIKSAIKVVRGCYMKHERQQAKAMGDESPIHPSKPLTDSSYHTAVEHLMRAVKKGSTCVMVASHNRETIEKTLHLMQVSRIPPNNGRVVFGQLLGMGDHLTYPLASAGYIANKVVPYGSMDDMMPFLSRRGNENRGMMKNAQDERFLYSQEFKRRIFS